MEMVLDVYKRPYDTQCPVVCMDESPKQLIAENPHSWLLAAHPKLTMSTGVAESAISSWPASRLAGKWMVRVTERKTKRDWALFLEEIADMYENAKKITLVMDNLSTHNLGSFYKIFSPDKAKALWDRFEFIYMPKHGSWLNMTEIELNFLTGQCLRRRIDRIEKVEREVSAWQKHRDSKNARVNWQFTAQDARIKLARLYSTLEC